ncbi:MAG: hypothetical protein FD127_4141, partial [Acidimicrobiaceae bacterium]
LAGDTLVLAPGSYSLEIWAGSLPPGFKAPASQAVTVAGSPPTASVDPVTFTLADSRVTLTGTVYNSFSGATAKVALDLYNGFGELIQQGIALARVGGSSDATYSVVLGEGTFDLALRRANGSTAAQVVLPKNTTVSVSGGEIQNPDADSGTGGTQVDITVPEVLASVAGTVALGGNGVANLDVVIRDPVDFRVVNLATTNGSGAYTLGLPAGYFVLTPDPASLFDQAPSAFPPSPYEINVATDGDVDVSGDASLCTGSGPEACSGVNFTLQAFNASTDALITGTVKARRTSSDAPSGVESALVHLLDPSTSRPRATALTGVDGSYSIFAPEGAWSVVVDPGTVNVSYPTIPADPVSVGVVGNGVSESNTTGSGNAADDGIVSFILTGASALVQGQVQTTDAIGVGARLVISTADATAMPTDFAYSVFTDPIGNYFLPMGLGSFKLWIDQGSLPAGFLPPVPISF